MSEFSDHKVIQSSSLEDLPAWKRACLESVQSFAISNGMTYQFIGDELFDFMPHQTKEMLRGRNETAADICRLRWIVDVLDAGADAVTWIDSDVLIFPGAGRSAVMHPFTREWWIGRKRNGILFHRKGLNNCVMTFSNSDLPRFMLRMAWNILLGSNGFIRKTMIGPEIVEKIAQVTRPDFNRSILMVSPALLKELAEGRGVAMDLHERLESSPQLAANLCASLRGRTLDGVEVTNALLSSVVKKLSEAGQAPLQGRICQ